MKRSLLILFLVIGSSTLNAQELSLEETITYIRDKALKKEENYRYQDHISFGEGTYSTVSLQALEISKDGQIKLSSVKYYDTLVFDLKRILKVELLPDIPTYVCFYVTKSSFFILQSPTQIDAERLRKAFIHLKGLLPNEKDPFDK